MAEEIFLKKRVSFLSPEVKRIFQEANSEFENFTWSKRKKEKEKHWIEENFSFNWSLISSVFEENASNFNKGTPSWFIHSAKGLSPLFNECQDMIDNLASESFTQHVCPLLEWTHQVDQIQWCWELSVCDKKSPEICVERYNKNEDTTDELFSACDSKREDTDDGITLKSLFEREKELDFKESVISDTDVYFRNMDESRHLLNLLILTSITERALGNVFLLKGTQVPFLLKDLLATPELKEILGKDLVSLLILILGSVFGVNLRNLCWHGFLTVPEVASIWPAVLLMLLAQCGHMLQQNHYNQLTKRDAFVFQKLDDLENKFSNVAIPSWALFEPLLQESPVVPTVTIPTWKFALQMYKIERYGEAVVLILPLVECSLRLMFASANDCPSRILTAQNSSFYTTLNEILAQDITVNNVENYENANMKDVTKLDLTQEDVYLSDTTTPILEKADKSQLELKSSHDNNAKSQELASSSQQYAKGLQIEIDHQDEARTSKSKPNQVISVLGTKLTEALYDLLHFMSGPRLRDHISHGEVDLAAFPKCLTKHLIHLSVLVVTSDIQQFAETKTEIESHFFAKAEATSIEQTYDGRSDKSYEINEHRNCFYDKFEKLFSLEAISYLERLNTCLVSYQSLYHPTSLLQEGLGNTLKLLSEWKEWPRPQRNHLDYLDWHEYTDGGGFVLLCPLSSKLMKIKPLTNVKEVEIELIKVKYEVLYRPRVEIELISIAHRITIRTNKALTIIQENLVLKLLLFDTKKLRTRQRDSYQKQLSIVPHIISYCHIICQLMMILLLSINSTDNLEKSAFSSLMKTLKSVLKVVENICSQTGINMNRWDEALHAANGSIETIKKTFGTRD